VVGSEGPTSWKRVRLADVAAVAGVSAATVSNALNGKPGVSAEVRVRIQVVADGLGYRTNTVAQELRRGHSRSIGLALVDVSNPFYADVAKGVIEVADQNGFATLISHVGPESEHLEVIAETFLDRRLAGGLFTSLCNADASTLKLLQKQHLPFVKLVRDVAGVDADWVGIDDFAGGSELGNHIADVGCRRVAFLGGPSDSNASAMRGVGLRSSLSSRGVLVLNGSDASISGSLSRTSGSERAHAVLDQCGPIDALVGGNDVIALGILDACRERGIDVPRDMLVAGFDNMSFSHVGPLQLTTVNVPREDLGRKGACFLFDRIQGYSGPGRRAVLPHELIIRDTTTR